jgi:hypothetical protein
MSDARDRFNWPPTAEELDSIHVIEMHDVPAASRQLVPRAPTVPVRVNMPLVTPAGDHAPSAWQRFVDRSTLAQGGLLAASLAAIGLAVTSLLAPAQPVVRAQDDARPALAAYAPAPLSADTTPAVPSASPKLPRFRTPAVAPGASALLPHDDEQESPASDETPVATGRADTVSEVSPRPTNSHWVNRRAARRAAAGSDPVSRFATRTGTSVWRALRVVGRSWRRNDDGRVWASRPRARAAIARRTAAAVDLEAGAAPSAR